MVLMNCELAPPACKGKVEINVNATVSFVLPSVGMSIIVSTAVDMSAVSGISTTSSKPCCTVTWDVRHG